MKNKLIIILYILFVVLPYFELECQYIWQNVLAKYLAVKATDTNTFYIVGNDGLIIRSQDFGNTFSRLESFVKTNFRCIDFINSQKIVIAGDSGFVVLTEDGGENWKKFKLNCSSIKGVSFLNETSFFLVSDDGKIIRTTDNGLTFELLYENPLDEFVNVKIFNNGYGFVLSKRGKIIRTHDFGNMWSKVYEEKDSSVFTCMDFYDFRNGCASGYPGTFIIYTTDAGTTWKKIKTQSSGIFTINYLAEKKIIAFGNIGTCIRTNDLFNSFTIDTLWSKKYTLIKYPMFILSSSSFDKKKIVCTGTERSLLVSVDTGITFDYLKYSDIFVPESGSAGFIYDVIEVNDSILLFCKQKTGVLRSDDNCVTIEEVFPSLYNYRFFTDSEKRFWKPILSESSGTDCGFYFDDNHNAILGHRGLTRNTIIYLTGSNLGKTWKLDSIIYARELAWNDNCIIAVSGNGIYISSDSGKTWNYKKVLFNDGEGFYSITHHTDNRFYVLSYQNGVPTDDTITFPYGIKTLFRVYKSNDNYDFDSLVIYDDNHRWLRRLKSVNDKIFLLGANDKQLLYSDDNGLTWKSMNTPFQETGNILYLDDGSYLICGFDDSIAFSYDNGKSWKVEVLGFSTTNTQSMPSFRKAKLLKNGTIILIGSDRIVRGIKKNNSSVESKFIKRLNEIIIHPNPASDYIEINLERSPTNSKSLASEIRIYNTYGELILSDFQYFEDIVHHKRIDISHLPVGIYFIKIENYLSKFIVVK